MKQIFSLILFPLVSFSKTSLVMNKRDDSMKRVIHIDKGIVYPFLFLILLFSKPAFSQSSTTYNISGYCYTADTNGYFSKLSYISGFVSHRSCSKR